MYGRVISRTYLTSHLIFYTLTIYIVYAGFLHFRSNYQYFYVAKLELYNGAIAKGEFLFRKSLVFIRPRVRKITWPIRTLLRIYNRLNINSHFNPSGATCKHTYNYICVFVYLFLFDLFIFFIFQKILVYIWPKVKKLL